MAHITLPTLPNNLPLNPIRPSFLLTGEGGGAPKPSGKKDDLGKLPYDLIDDAAEAEMVAVLGFGATKYSPGNWRHVAQATDRYFAAARRHFRASRRGEVLDPEHGLFTLASAACCVHFLLALELARHPDLAASLEERYGRSLEVARRLRADRQAREAEEAARRTQIASPRPTKTRARKKKSGRK